eukprot:873556_1
MDEIELNKSQKKLIHQIARYNALFALGSVLNVVSLIGFTLSLAVAINKGERYYPQVVASAQIFTNINGVVNVICLYLQYSFATKHYQKYCGCLDLCWKNIFNRKAMKLLKHEYHNASTEAEPKQRANSESETETTQPETDDVHHALHKSPFLFFCLS